MWSKSPEKPQFYPHKTSSVGNKKDIFFPFGKDNSGSVDMKIVEVFEGQSRLLPILNQALEKYGGLAMPFDAETVGRGRIIICGHGVLPETLPKKNFTAIASERNLPLLSFFEKSRIKTVSCGTGPKNSITLSSLGPNRASICLTRQWGHIYPCEFSVSFGQDLTPEELLLISAGLLIGAGYREDFFI